jgi:hypothetical protein
MEQTRVRETDVIRGRGWPKPFPADGEYITCRVPKKPRAMPFKKWIKSQCIVDEQTGCWLWQRAIQVPSPANPGGGGYGYTTYRGKFQTVHRAVWQIWYGRIPKGRTVAHQCDVRNCANPEHLWLSTRKQNAQDMSRKGRAGGMKAGDKLYNNGIVNRIIKADAEIPEGFTLGTVPGSYGGAKKKNRSQ